MRMVPPIAPLMRERGFSIQLGSFRFDAWDRRVVRPIAANGGDYSSKPLINWRLGASAAVCMLVAVSIGLATQHASARSAYSVVVAVPDALPKGQTIVDAKPEASSGSPTRPPSAKVIARPVSQPVPGLIAPTVADPAIAKPAPLVSVATAMRMATATGEAQEWGDLTTATHGFVVAGAAEDTDRGQCRNLSVLTRKDGEPDTVKQQRVCTPASVSAQLQRPPGN